MKKNNIVLFTIILFIFQSFAFSQNSKSYFQMANDYFDKGDYENAVFYYEKNLPFDKSSYGENHIYIGNDYFLIGACYKKLGKYDKAISNFKKSLEIYESTKVQSNKSQNETKVDAAKSASDSALELGNVYEAIGEFKTALIYFQKELAINLRIYGDKHIKTSDAYRNVGYMNLQCGNYEESILDFLKSAEIRKTTFSEKSLEFVESIIDLAVIYTNTGNYTSALENLKRAEEIYKSLLQSDDINFAYLYQRFADYYRQTANLNLSLEYGYKAISIFDKNYGENNSASIAVYLAEIEKCYSLLGDDNRSLAILLKCKNYYEMSPHQNLINVLKGLSDIYRNKGDYKNSIIYCQKAIETCKKYWGERNTGMADLYHSLGLIYVLKKDYEVALSYFAKAVDLYIELKQEDTEEMLSLVTSISTAYFGLDDYENAEYYQNEVCRIAHDLGYTGTESTAYYSLGILYQEPSCQNIEKSVECFRKCFELRKNSVFYKSTINSAMQAFYITAGLKSFSQKKDFFREMISLVADTAERARIDMESQKSDMLKEILPIYYYAVDFEAMNSNPEKAFEYSEMLRSREFLDQIGLERALSLDGVTDFDREHVNKLKKQISIARKEIEVQSKLSANERDSEKMAQAEKNLSTAENALSKLDDKIAKMLPSYAQLRNPQTIKIKDAQKLCGKNRAILEYVVWNPKVLDDSELLKSQNMRTCADDIKFSSYCLVITKKQVVAVPLDDDYDFTEAVTKLRDGVIPKRAKPTPETKFEDIRNEIYTKLIEPILPYTKGCNELLIVPDVSLAFLPFDILRKDENSKMLCEQFAISLSPSVSVSMIADSSKTKGLEMLAFGASWYDKTLSTEEYRKVFDTQDMARGKSRGFLLSTTVADSENAAQDLSVNLNGEEIPVSEYFNRRNMHWGDLPGTIIELNTLKNKAVGSKKYNQMIQENASEMQVKLLSKDGTLSKYPILHFACHGYFDKDNSNMSSILFSEVSGKLSTISNEDGYLTIPEVSVLNLDADMVCLSACETGLGEIKTGDGMTGLSRAFMVAGSRHVGVSLWQVDDEATAQFMASMYKKIEKKGMTYEQAYQQTKVEFRKSEDYSHPYYWSAFVLYE